ncbi:abortive infection family protein [Trichocoleus sp. FACHB-262]|uniref:abortive infection family protein n=1 Tax=Trichocoleus sp. FACHB-262 TaxID=2692869 RepID=UPI0016891D3D|nr:abortive infection family protein [Trichocoleus sp. FACHB-262]MBD2123123.1 abortive infection family protein [Trichocoleus sp. FACHB-262]
MLLYHAGGARDVELIRKQFSAESWTKLRDSVIRLLKSRNLDYPAELLETIPFDIYEATNGFQDKFSVLNATVELDLYTKLVHLMGNSGTKLIFRTIAETVTEVGSFIRFIIVDLKVENEIKPVASPSPQITSEVLEYTLADAEQLIQSRSAVSGVDRVHTSFHAYLQAVCTSSGLPIPKDASITQLFKVIRTQHPALQSHGPQADSIERIVQSTATILDALNPVRNRASLAHPNDQILDEPEAMLVINSVRTLLHYLDKKIK